MPHSTRSRFSGRPGVGRCAFTTAIAAIALSVGSAGPALAAPDELVSFSPVSVDKLAASIQSQISGRTFGWQFAVAQNGKFAASGKGGTAISAKDTGAAPAAMAATTRMDIASATKTITAISTMKLLRANGLTVESKVAPYLPAGWTRGKGFGPNDEKPILFRHLLGHTSGVNQAIVLNGSVPNGWVGSKTIVSNGAVADSARAYHNHNYGLLRVLNAQLWKQGPVTQQNHAAYALEHMRKHIFEPAGLNNVGCEPADPQTAMRSYPANATQSSKGQVHKGGPESCAGHRGLFLSSMDHVRLLAHLRHGNIIHPDDRNMMDELRLGWDPRSDKGYFAGAFFHGGALFGGLGDLHTCGATFTDGTEVSMMVNSPIAAVEGEMGTPCGIVVAAWKASI